jgi:hypothetical protein
MIVCRALESSAKLNPPDQSCGETCRGAPAIPVLCLKTNEKARLNANQVPERHELGSPPSCEHSRRRPIG